MSDAQSLFLLLVLLYLSDCLWWLGWNSGVLESPWLRGRWRWRVAGGVTGNQKRALVLLRPLPSSVNLQLDPWAFSVSPGGLLAWSSAAWSPMGRPVQAGWSRLWSDVETIEVSGEAVVVDGRELQRFATANAAGEVAEWLEGLHAAPLGQREALIERLWDRRMRTDGIEERVEKVLAEARALRIGGAVQWVWMFALAPAVTVAFGGGWVLVGLALGVLALVVINISIFVRRHRRLFPERRWARIEGALVMGVSWPMAARAADLLCRHALADLDPLAVAAALDGMVGREEHLSRVLRDSEHPLQLVELDQEGLGIARWHQERMAPRIRRLVEEAGVRVETPLRCSEGDVAYCPRCGATYRRRAPECSGCAGVELLAFAAGVPAATGVVE